MKALVYHGPDQRSWDTVKDPTIVDPTDIIVRIDTSTICGSDLHILKGHVPETTPGTVLGHEAVGTVQEVGASVSTVVAGDRVLLSCVTSCGRCRFCKEHRYGQCLGGGGWIFGHLIDGLQAEYARVPFADNSVYKIPDELSDEQVLFLADILPTAFEVGVLNGMVSPGDVVAIVGAGPVGLAAILTAKLYTPGRIVAIDLADTRLDSALRFGADTTINNGREDAVERIMKMTDGLGAGRRLRGGRRPRDVRAHNRANPSRRQGGEPSACTVNPRRCTSRSCGSATSPSQPDSSTPTQSLSCWLSSPTVALTQLRSSRIATRSETPWTPTTPSPTRPTPAR